MLTRQQKEAQVQDIKTLLEGMNAVMLVDYRGLSVPDSIELRQQLRQAGDGIRYRVAKNTLMKRAVEGTDAAALEPHLVGPNAIAVSYDEPSALAKVLVDYAEKNEKFEIRAGVVEGELVDLVQIQKLAALPTKHELQGMLAGTLQAPLRNLAGTLYALLGHVRNALEQRQSQLEVS
jgi:large subunit ribosomal protein L10